jgi:hypothetical protein
MITLLQKMTGQLTLRISQEDESMATQEELQAKIDEAIAEAGEQ